MRLAWLLRQRQAIPLCRTGSLSESIIVMGVAIWAGLTILRLHPRFGLWGQGRLMTGVLRVVGKWSVCRLAQPRRRPANADSRIRLGFRQ